MEWKYESKKKFLITILICFLLGIAVVCGLSYAQYGSYNEQYNKKLTAMCMEIEKKYPDITDVDIIKLMNADGKIDRDYFMRYGIDISKDSVVKQNGTIFYRYLVINVITFLAGVSVVALVAYKMNGKQQRRICRIADYLKNINQGDYSFYMEDSAEGNLSILESEVYKTTIMLKENADNSKLDKQKLKDSLSDISHQLKTPITSLLINLENLENNPDLDSGRRNSLIGNAKRDTNRISQMVGQLLTLSRLDANVIEFKKEKISLGEIAGEAKANVDALADLLGISVIEENAKDAEASIICDGYWEKQAITNLVKNAVEHAASRVVIRYMNCELYKEIVVENDGEPISEEDRKNVFKRFYSGQHSTTDSVGIGLSLANAVVKNDGGYIVIESDENIPDSGVKFIVRYV